MKRFRPFLPLFLATLSFSACHGLREPYTPFPLSSAPLPPAPRTHGSSNADTPQAALNGPISIATSRGAPADGQNGAAFPPPALTPTPAEAGGDMTVKRVAGVWNATILGTACKLATPQTKFGEGFRAGPLHCPTPLDKVKSWNLAEKELVLYGATGDVLARLHFAAGRYDGKFDSGEPLTLSR